MHRGPLLPALVLAAALAAAAAAAQAIGAWTVAGSGAGIYSATADGGVLVYCSDDGAPEVDVGPYGVRPDTEYLVTFHVDGRAPLRLHARVGPATAVVVAGDDAAALIAHLSDAAATEVTMALAHLTVPGGVLAFEVPTFGLPAALRALTCAPS